MAAIAFTQQDGADYTAPAIEPVWDDEPGYQDHLQITRELDELREDNARLTAQLARAHQILRAIKRIEPKPARCEGFEDDAAANLASAYAQAHANIRTRVDLYLATCREAQS
jgi:hypothetical protein